LVYFFQAFAYYEEKKKRPLHRDSTTHPQNELAQKTRWRYDPASYIIGYHAIGTIVTLAGIHKDGAGAVKVTDVHKVDLESRLGRIKNATRMIKLCKLLRVLEKQIEEGVDKEMLPLTRDDKTIEYRKGEIRKTYQGCDATNRILHLQIIYQHLADKGVPNTDMLKKADLRRSFVDLKPRGINEGPTTLSDVRNAIVCVLETLIVLHDTEPKIFHRDIRWPNIIQNASNKWKWFLIDWEDASTAPTTAVAHMNHQTHAPQVKLDNHGAEVDLWGVGYLIISSTVQDLPESLNNFGKRLMNGQISTAKQALAEMKSVSIF